ncbi:MAG: CocE/NonD family hydrolase [Actinomycetota bacterium]|nr:MAG: CocE/NonD family hydrolase [Actinomycetota bacterium]
MTDVRRQFRRAVRRLRNAAKPAVTVTAPPTGVVVERDVVVTMPDGVDLRVNVFRPDAGSDGDRARPGPTYPVVLSAHPYGKDNLPRRKPAWLGGGYTFAAQYHAFPQPDPISFSAWTSWEAPDPGWWVPRGYVVVNADLRGFGHSDGTAELLSEQEAADYEQLIAWAASQPWSNGRVGLLGVSYLALAQYRVAARRPPHLAAICPWEGFSDLYRDFARPGGVREDGFLPLWSRLTARAGRVEEDLRAQQAARPLWDDWWQSKTPDLTAIDVPMLVCGSFSDHDLHSRGSFEAFRRAGSADKRLFTHRGGKWSTFYSAEALAAQHAFFEDTLVAAPAAVPATPAVRLEVRSAGAVVADVRHESAFPPAGTAWRTWYLTAPGALVDIAAANEATYRFDTATGRARFVRRIAEDVELVGPVALRLYVETIDCPDIHVFAGIELWRNGIRVGFEGSYGFADDLLTHGMQKSSHRDLDPDLSATGVPVHSHRDAVLHEPGEIVPVDVALLPSATRVSAGDEIHLVVQGHWFFPVDPLRGQFPAKYEASPPGTAVLHCGGRYDAALLVPELAVPTSTPTPTSASSR